MPFPKKYIPDQVTQHAFDCKREKPVRLDLYLAGRIPTLSRNLIQTFLKEGRAKVNGRTARASTKVRRGDRIEIGIPHVIRPKMVPTEIPLDILYEDEHFIAMNKPAGLVMHPSTGHWEDTLVNAVVAHVGIPVEATDIVRPGIVHRLDKDTSGVTLMGKSNTGLDGLAKQFRDRTIRKEYHAIVHGCPDQREGVIDRPIARNRKDDKKMGVARQGTGQSAQSSYRVLEGYPAGSLVSVLPRTGRMHQIRVHMMSIGHPCVGDPLYEGEHRREDVTLPRQALHARRLIFKHPATGEPMDLTAPLPDDMEKLLESLRTRG